MKKYQILILSLLFDTLGYVSFVIPGIGEFSDVVWAPVSSWLMTKLYKGREGQIAAAFSFVEEIFPFSDVIPTFTLMWLYTFVYKADKNLE